MQRMFDPKTIAVIGASETEGSVGRTIMDNAMASAGRDRLPDQPEARDDPRPARRTRASATSPAEIDLAMVATPAATVPDVLAQCAAAGVHGAIVVSAGFSRDRRDRARCSRRASATSCATARCASSGPTAWASSGPTVGLNASFLQHQPRAGQHRAHLAERRAGHRHARLGDRRARRASRCSPRWAAWSTSTSPTSSTSSARTSRRAASSSTWRASGTRGAS